MSQIINISRFKEQSNGKEYSLVINEDCSVSPRGTEHCGCWGGATFMTFDELKALSLRLQDAVERHDPNYYEKK